MAKFFRIDIANFDVAESLPATSIRLQESTREVFEGDVSSQRTGQEKDIGGTLRWYYFELDALYNAIWTADKTMAR